MVTLKNNKHKIKILHELHSPIEYYTLPKTYKITYIDDEGRTPLMIACIDGNMEDVKKYISEINCVDDDGWSALMYAAYHGQLDIFLFLREQGADVDKTTHSGLNAYQLAYFNGQYDISQLG
jgi:ankyrin repeat protein